MEKAIFTFVLLLLLSFSFAAEAGSEKHIYCDGPKSVYMGGTCVSACPANYQLFTFGGIKRCIYKPTKLSFAPSRLNYGKSKCSEDQLAMFFSWVSYEQDPARMLFSKFSTERGYTRLDGCGEWQIRNEYHYELDLQNTHVTVADNEKLGIVVVAYRGTEGNMERICASYNDWVFTNFDLFKKGLTIAGKSCGKVHKGFKECVESVHQQLQPQIVEYAKAGYRVIFTGHSQGGATSTLEMLYNSMELPQYKKQFQLITFASPRVGNDDFTSCFSKQVDFEKVTHYRSKHEDTTDLVTTVPPKLMGFRHVPGSAYYVPCYKKNFGNPQPIPGISFTGPAFVPYFVGCHYQQVYMDGLLEGRRAVESSELLSDDFYPEEATSKADVREFFEAVDPEYFLGLE